MYFERPFAVELEWVLERTSEIHPLRTLLLSIESATWRLEIKGMWRLSSF